MDPRSTPCLSPSLAEDLQFSLDCSTSVTEVKDPECKLGPESHTEIFGDSGSSSDWDMHVEDAELSSSAFTVPGCNEFISPPMPMLNISVPLIQLEIKHRIHLVLQAVLYTFIIALNSNPDSSSDLESLDPELQQFDLLMCRLLDMLPNGLVCFCSSDRHTQDEEAEFSSSAFVMPCPGDFTHLPMFNIPGCTRIQTFLSLGILTVLSAFKTPFSWSTDSPPPAESSSELSDLEQLQLLIDYLLALLSTDYISTAIPIKPSTVLYYLFGVSTTASGSSSKKRLLLHDGWLEMWAIILLLSSDVERNPGPRQITDAQLSKVDNRVLDKQDLFEVRDATFACRKCWFDLCLALRLPYDDLSAIRMEYGGDTAVCLREGLCVWLQGEGATWRALVDAVANTSGGNNLALALEIARKHEVSTQPFVNDPVPETDPERGQEIIVAFANMCRSVTRLLGRSLDVKELKDFLDYFCHPQALQQRCVDPEVYRGAKSTKDILKSLCPEHINPMKLFVLEGIVETFGSQRCKRLLRDYKENYC